MYLTSVDEKEDGEASLKGKSSLLIVDESGEEFTYSNFEDKPVFINYWATWCPPCRAEMPTLEKLFNDYKDKVNFLFITREPFDKTNEYLDNNGYNIPVYRIKSRPEGSLSYSVLPTSLLISKNNELVFRKEGAVNWHSDKIKKIFRKTIDN
jgi:thiol-disulfide isomerase/thioredoxin